MFCIHCGKQVPDETMYCPACGKRVSEEKKGDSASFTQADREMLDKKKNKKQVQKGKRKKTVSIIIAISIVIVLIVSIFLYRNCRKTADTYISFAKSICPKDFPEKSFGEVFDSFFENPEWKYFSEGGEHWVVFSGRCSLDGRDTVLKMQFRNLDLTNGMYGLSPFYEVDGYTYSEEATSGTVAYISLNGSQTHACIDLSDNTTVQEDIVDQSIEMSDEVYGNEDIDSDSDFKSYRLNEAYFSFNLEMEYTASRMGNFWFSCYIADEETGETITDVMTSGSFGEYRDGTGILTVEETGETIEYATAMEDGYYVIYLYIDGEEVKLYEDAYPAG